MEAAVHSRRRVIPAAFLALFAALLPVEPARSQTSAFGAKPGPAGRLEVTDEAGRHVLVPAAVRRIVSLAPSLTETMYALGLEERLVGVTDYCDYPPEAQTKPRVGGAINPNLEQVVALKPDLVVATRALDRRETVEALERLGVTVYVTDPRTVEGVLESIARLAEVTGARERGKTLVEGMRARLAGLRERLAARALKRVLFVVWQDPLISIGQHTFLADALRWAGAESVVETDQDWPRLSIEEVIRLQPDYLVFAGSHSEGFGETVEGLAVRPGWRKLDAVEQRRIVLVSDALNRPAPRLVDAIEQLARELHREAFAEPPRPTEEKTGKPGDDARKHMIPKGGFSCAR